MWRRGSSGDASPVIASASEAIQSRKKEVDRFVALFLAMTVSDNNTKTQRHSSSRASAKRSRITKRLDCFVALAQIAPQFVAGSSNNADKQGDNKCHWQKKPCC